MVLRVLRVLGVLVVLTGPGLASAQSPSGGVIQGRVVDGASGRPVSAAIVSIAGAGMAVNATFGLPNQPPRVLVGSDGRFVFTGLSLPGSFTITATKGGYADGASGRRRPGGSSQPVQISAVSPAVDVVVRVWRNGAITGTVNDESGEPVVGVQVRLLARRMNAGRRESAPIATPNTVTDDRGIYRFSNLPPGDYLVMASPPLVSIRAAVFEDIARTGRGNGELGLMLPFSTNYLEVDDAWIALRPGTPVPSQVRGTRLRTYPTTFHPAAASSAQATVVTLSAGDERASIDIQLNPVPTSRVSGIAFDASSAPAFPLVVRLQPVASSDVTGDTLGLMSSTDTSGAFVFPGVAPGDYMLRATRPAEQAAGMQFADVPVSVGGDNIDGLAAVLSPALSVTARMQFDGQAPPPPARPSGRFGDLFAVEPIDAPAAINTIGTVSDGQYTLAGFRPGRYRVRPVNSPSGWMFKAAMLDGVDVSETPFDLRRDVVDLVLVFTDRWSGISGAVQGNGALDSTVLVFPTDAQSWSSPSARRTRSARPNDRGQFGFGSLPPGNYYIVAVRDDDGGDWRDPAMLEALAPVATQITIVEGEHKTLDLPMREVRR